MGALDRWSAPAVLARISGGVADSADRQTRQNYQAVSRALESAGHGRVMADSKTALVSVCHSLPGVAESRNQVNQGFSHSVCHSAKPAGVPSADPDEIAERLAIISESGAPPDWAEAYATLQALPCPDWLADDRWRRIVDAAGVFLDRWSRAAALLGWDARTFMGLRGDTQAPRYDSSGLAEALADVTVCAVTHAGITVRFPDGGTRAIRKTVGGGWVWG